LFYCLRCTTICVLNKKFLVYAVSSCIVKSRPLDYFVSKHFLVVIVITNSYLNYSWKNWIGIIFHLFTTVCKYGVSTLQYTLQNMVVGQYSITILNTIYILSFIHMLKSHVFWKATSCYFVSLIVRLFTFYRLELKKLLCEKYFFLLRQIRQFWCYARFLILYDTEKRCF
jgi:hypothetical protein